MSYFSGHDIININIKASSNNCCQEDGQTGLSLSLASGLHITDCLGGEPPWSHRVYCNTNPGKKQLGGEPASGRRTVGILERGMLLFL